MTTVQRARVDVRRIHRAADRHVATVSETIVASARAVRSRVTLSVVAEDLATAPNDPRRLLVLIDMALISKAAEPAEDRLRTTLEAILADGAGVAIDLALDGQQATHFATQLKIKSPVIQEAARDLTSTLIRDVGDKTKRAVSQIMFEAYRDGLAPEETAPLVRRVVGLTRGQALAVKAREALSPGTADSFAEALLRRRAMTIARTETMRAANRGQQEAWRAMQRDPAIATLGMKQQWITTPDDRLCELCAPMSDKIVALGSPFESTERGVLPSQREAFAGGTVESPPLHPQCRCTLGAVFE